MSEGLLAFADHLPNCHACQYGKQKWRPFPKSTWRATHKLHLIHTDVSSPQRTVSLVGSQYYMVFIDDFTRLYWIFFLKFKSKVARVFWKFKKMVENQSGCKIQVLRSDNGKEYASKEFNLFSKQAGIEHQFTTPYTPQQHGVSEKRNIYIMQMTRCMLHDKELPKKFWVEAVSTVVFLQNRLPTKALKNKTPYEAWYSYKPSFNFLKVFDCVCFSHIPQVKHVKLDKKSEPGIFVGYSSTSKAYKVYQPQTGKLIVSKDVFFNEYEKWNWEQTQETSKSKY